MTPLSMFFSPRKAFASMNPPKFVVDSAALGSPAEPAPKRQRRDMDSTPSSFAALAERAPSRSHRPSSAKRPVEMGDAETAPRLNQFVFGARTTFRDEIDSMLHGDTDAKYTQTNWRNDQYDAQISGIKGRLHVSETIVESLKNHIPAMETLLVEQEKEISTLASETKVQGDMIKQQSDELEKQGLMIQKLQELCIKNDGNKGKLMDFHHILQYGTFNMELLAH
jgi:hypothetical protein